MRLLGAMIATNIKKGFYVDTHWLERYLTSPAVQI